MGSSLARRVTEAMDSGWPSHEAIEERAYELYMQRPVDQGSALEDWLRAERELTRPAAAPRPRRSLRQVIGPDLSSKLATFSEVVLRQGFGSC